MSSAIIGFGAIGQALARAFARKNLQVTVASRREPEVNVIPLKDVPPVLGNWLKFQDGVIDQETLDVLKADDTLNREYIRNNGEQAMLFVAMFKSQRNGKTPQSPKNCLPGSGWVQEDTRTIHIDVPGYTTPVEANRYLVAKGDTKAVVVYWYQSRERSVASEYLAKFYVIEDAIHFNRTDIHFNRKSSQILAQRLRLDERHRQLPPATRFAAILPFQCHQ